MGDWFIRFKSNRGVVFQRKERDANEKKRERDQPRENKREKKIRNFDDYGFQIFLKFCGALL